MSCFAQSIVVIFTFSISVIKMYVLQNVELWLIQVGCPSAALCFTLICYFQIAYNRNICLHASIQNFGLNLSMLQNRPQTKKLSLNLEIGRGRKKRIGELIGVLNFVACTNRNKAEKSGWVVCKFAACLNPILGQSYSCISEGDQCQVQYVSTQLCNISPPRPVCGPQVSLELD